MSSRHTQGHKARNRQQFAEESFERTWSKLYGTWTREGWAYPSWNDGTEVGRDLRGLTASQPDYYARTHDGGLFHVEVKGGLDEFNAINHRWNNTAEWARFLPEDTVAYLYNSQRGEYIIVDALVLHWANQKRETRDYHDGGYYYVWTWDELKEIGIHETGEEVSEHE